MARKTWDLTDAQWHAIEAVLPRSRGGRPRINDRLIITGILHSLATGAPFAELEAYANPSTLETRFRRWDRDGTLQCICEAIGFTPLSPHERHLRHGMGQYQRGDEGQRLVALLVTGTSSATPPSSSCGRSHPEEAPADRHLPPLAPAASSARRA
jgi:hypothetical protein